MLSKITAIWMGRLYIIVCGFRFYPANWDGKTQTLTPMTTLPSWFLWGFWFILLSIKSVYLLISFIECIHSGISGDILYHVCFIMAQVAAAVLMIELLYHLHRNCGLFTKTMQLNNTFKKLFMPHIKEEYILQRDGVDQQIKGMLANTTAMTVCVLALAIQKPRKVHFLHHLIPLGYFENDMQEIGAKIGLALLEAALMGQTWFIHSLTQAQFSYTPQLLGFWCHELKMYIKKRKNLLTRQQSNWTHVAYRQMQVLNKHFNEAESWSLATVHFIAFVNQIATNYGTLKLFGVMSMGTWVSCPVLSVMGGLVLFESMRMLGYTYDRSIELSTLGSNVEFKSVYARKFWKSTCPLNVRSGDNLYHYTRSSGPSYTINIVNWTISLLLSF